VGITPQKITTGQQKFQGNLKDVRTFCYQIGGSDA
jgi:hypothetical protein